MVRAHWDRSPLLKWAVVIILTAILVWQIAHLTDPTVVPVDDFVEYWAAGRLNLTDGNPYAPDQLRTLETEAGWPEDEPVVMMWNPPWTLTLVMPFGLLSYSTGRLLWLGLHFVLILLCADWAWRLYGGPSHRRWLAWLIAFSFAPSLFVLNMGQISTLILVGVLGFLHFGKQGRWGLAGASAALIAIKPHLLYLFWIAVLLWALDQRHWSVLLGGALAGLAATAIPLAFNPNVISQYLVTALNEPPLYWATPTLGAVLRLLLGVDRHWLQFAPTMIGLSWFLIYWQRRKHRWDWTEQMPLLLLVSVLTTSHGWEYDQVVLLPAVMQAAVWVYESKQRVAAGLAVGVHLAITSIAIAINIVIGSNFWYVWLAPVLLAFYLILRIQLKYRAEGAVSVLLRKILHLSELTTVRGKREVSHVHDIRS